MDCRHEDWEYRKVTQARTDGKIVYMRTAQCLKCGRRVKFSRKDLWLPNQGDEANLPEFDKDFERKLYDSEIQKRNDSRIAKFRQKHREYEIYICTSPEWRNRREKVLKRAGYICECCLDKKASQVHHMNYDSLFNEILWDLKAVCYDCHKKIHDVKFAPSQPFD